MSHRLGGFLIALGLSTGLLWPSPADAQSRGSGGKSYSSGSSSRGSSSPSKSYSSGSSSSKSSPFSSGKSYSSGSSTSKQSPSFGGSSSSKSAPRSSSSSGSPSSASSSGGKSYSSGSGAKPSGVSKPAPKSSYDSNAGTAQKKSESSGSFSSRTNPNPPAPSSGGSSPNWSTSGKSYSSGGSSPSPSSSPPRTASSSGGKSYSAGKPAGEGSSRAAPTGPKFDQAAAAAQQREESKKTFTKGDAPRTTYSDPSGTSRPIDPRAREIDDLRRDLDQQKWENRELRKRQTYSPYYGERPVVVYRDPYSNLFWWWLLAQSLDTRASWAYHHRDSMDQARYREMLQRDAQLEARVRQLEQQGTQRDPGYQPAGVDRDLMYTDDYVEAAYNPQPPPGAPMTIPSRSTGRGMLTTLLIIALILGFLCFAVWFVFFKRWTVS